MALAPEPADLEALPGGGEFTWRDGERTVVFGPGLLPRATAVLADHGWTRYELATTERALAAAPVELPARAGKVHEIGSGPVPELARELLDAVGTPTLVALGGGRVIDAAKAVAAVRGGRVGAIPTTLSGAEMTRIHRLPEGASAPHLVRPALVIWDPELLDGMVEGELRASAMNALAHGAEPLYAPGANPVASLAALRGAELLASALDQGKAERDPARLALGALLCAYALDAGGYALHHVVCQSLVRVMGTPHAATNAAMLPHTLGAMRDRAPTAVAALSRSLRTDPENLPARVAELAGGARRLGDLGADADRLDEAVAAIMARAELAMTPDPPDAVEVRVLLERAW